MRRRTATNLEAEFDPDVILRALDALKLLMEVVPPELRMELFYLDSHTDATLRQSLEVQTLFSPCGAVHEAPLWRLRAGMMLKALKRDGGLNNVRWSDGLETLYQDVLNLRKEVNAQETWERLKQYLTAEGTMARKDTEAAEAKAEGRSTGSKQRLSDADVIEWIETQPDDVLSGPKSRVLKLFRQEQSCEQSRFQNLLEGVRKQRFPDGLPDGKRAKKGAAKPRAGDVKKAKAAAKAAVRKSSKPKPGRAQSIMERLATGAAATKKAEAAKRKAIAAAKRAKLSPDEVAQAGREAFDAMLAQAQQTDDE